VDGEKYLRKHFPQNHILIIDLPKKLFLSNPSSLIALCIAKILFPSKYLFRSKKIFPEAVLLRGRRPVRLSGLDCVPSTRVDGEKYLRKHFPQNHILIIDLSKKLFLSNPSPLIALQNVLRPLKRA